MYYRTKNKTKVNNPNFNCVGFHTVRNGEGRLLLIPKCWVEMTNAIGISQSQDRGQHHRNIHSTAMFFFS